MAYSDSVAMQTLKNYRPQSGPGVPKAISRPNPQLSQEAEQNRLRQTEAANNELLAQRYALDQSNMMQSSAANPRTVTDTSMTISSPGEGGGFAASGSRSSGSGGGGGGQLPADLAGRFMPLVGMDSMNLPSSPTPPEVQLGEADFSPQDATAFQNAAVGRTQALAGQQGQAAVKTLTERLAGRGIGKSGTLARGIGERIGLAQQPLTDLNVAHLGQEYGAAQRARELSENRAVQGFQGGIQQRGQSIQAQQALDALRAALVQGKYQGEIQQRGQDLSALFRGL